MPAVSVNQRTALIIKKGIKWVRAHGFDVVDPSARKHKKHKTHAAMVDRLRGR